MKKKAFVLNFNEEFILKNICGKKIIDYFFDFLFESAIDVVSFPKSSENFFKDFSNDSKIKITFNESNILKFNFLNDFIEDVKTYDGIMFMDYAYPNLDCIFSLKNSSITDDSFESSFGFYDKNGDNCKVIFINCKSRDKIFKIDFQNYTEKLSSMKKFYDLILDTLGGEKYLKNNIFDLDSNFNYIRTLNELKFIINKKHIDNGVIIIDPNNTFIDYNVEIGRNSVIYPGCVIDGETKIGENCIIYSNSRISSSTIDDGVQIQYSTIIESKILKDTIIGPYAYIRPETILGEHVKVGSFVELKKSTIGNNTKIPHLSYVGDAEVGESCNIGCGSIFANYDGNNKYKTKLGNNVFIGSNSNLVAPVLIHNNAYTAAGSTITQDVPENTLAIARARQVNIEGWIKKKKKK